LRPAFDALFGIDDAMADAVLRARDPALAAIKLAWWREQLQALDHRPPPAEPRLQAAADTLLPLGISGERLSAIEDGWLPLLYADPAAAHSSERGEIMFGLASSLLGVSVGPEVARIWALADLARGRGDTSLLDRGLVPVTKAARNARPLTALAALAARDHRKGVLEPEGTPGRAWTLLRHRLTGRYRG
jgi:phytoene synthase